MTLAPFTLPLRRAADASIVDARGRPVLVVDPDRDIEDDQAEAIADLILQALSAEVASAPKAEPASIAQRMASDNGLKVAKDIHDAFAKVIYDGKGWIYVGPENVDIGYETRPLYIYPAPASDELLEAAEALAGILEALLQFAHTSYGARLILDSKAQAKRDRAVAAIAKHKGPQ